MACYAAVSPLLRLLEDIIYHQRYPKFLLATQHILKSLHERFSFLEEFLLDISSAGSQETDSMEKLMRDAAYKARDSIETQISDLIVSGLNAQAVNRDLLQEVEQEVDSIMESVAAIKQTHRAQYSGRWKYSSRSNTSTSQQPSVGRNIMARYVENENWKIILDQLLWGGSLRRKVISIVGVGGIGKTTLIRNIFDHTLVRDNFDICVWVTVSKHYNIKHVLLGIIKDLAIGSRDELREVDVEVLMMKIYNHLYDRKYLLVIDDIWNTDFWYVNNRIFPTNDCGSRIVLTTRFLVLARAVGSNFIHEMHLLNEDESWNLFRERVFAQEICPIELVDIGKSIVSKCRGLPLEITVIAGVLSNLRKPCDWENISKSLSSKLSENDDRLSTILSFSYHHLPPQLKACLLYVGRFPENHVISVSKLVRLWVAEGYFKSSYGTKSSEKLAEECLEDLVERGLILINKRRRNGKIKFCNLHDLVRDFSRQRAHHENFFLDHKVGILNISLEFSPSSRLVRSVICFCSEDQSVYSVKWGYSKLLRVLEMSEIRLLEIPEFRDAALEMFHLKYLSFTIRNELRVRLTTSISQLQNLQTLVLYTTTNKTPILLPSTIRKMPQLRHLTIIKGTMILSFPPIVANTILQNLQTLETVEDFKLDDEVLAMVPSLRRLKLMYNRKLPCFDNLINLARLEELTINSRFRYGDHLSGTSSFSLNLKKLSLVGCCYPWNDPILSVVGSLPKLRVLKLKDNAFVGKEWEPVEGEFVSLKFLQLDWLNLKNWKAIETHFPCLEHLIVRNCRFLEKIPSKIGYIPTLKLIEVHDKWNELKDSAMKIEEEQQELGNHELQVRVYSMGK